jgi:uncharacterized protein YgiM (DUF1202 family)
LGDNKWSSSPKDFQTILQQSDVYKNAKSTDKIVVIIHACRTGRSYFDEKGNYVPSVAEQLSAAFPNLTIISPDERDFYTSSHGEIGPFKIAHPANKRADYAVDAQGRQMEGNSNSPGNWNVFQNGKWIGQYDADYKASGAPNWWNNEFDYHPVNIVITAVVQASNLNIRSSAGFGNNVIGKLSKGSNVSLTGNVNGSWSEISLDNGNTGWISTDKIKRNVSVSIDDKKKN